MKGLDKVPAKVRRKAEAIMAKIDAGEPVNALGGKRLKHDRSVVSFPLGRRWRMLAKFEDGKLEPLEVMSHEQYSKGARPGRR